VVVVLVLVLVVVVVPRAQVAECGHMERLARQKWLFEIGRSTL
jgi:hypothetical protein